MDIDQQLMRFREVGVALQRIETIGLHGRVAAASRLDGFAGGTRAMVCDRRPAPAGAARGPAGAGGSGRPAGRPRHGAGLRAAGRHRRWHAPAVLAPPACLAVDDGWLGRVVDPLGRPLDGLGPLRPRPVAAPGPRGAAPAGAARPARARGSISGYGRSMLRHLPAGPAAGAVRGLRHRQVHPAGDAGAPRRLATWWCWRWSASAGGSCGNSWRTISARPGWRVPW